MTSTKQEQRVLAKLSRDLGDEISGFLAASDVIEVMANPDGSLFVERHGQGMKQEGTLENNQIESIIATLAAMHDDIVDKNNPVLACTLPTGARFQAWVPPVTAACFCIRKPPATILTLAELVEGEVISLEQKNVLLDALKTKKNIVIAGGTGSGKTTFLNALLDEAVMQEPDERLFVLEDTAEIQSKARNAIFLLTTGAAELVDLVRTALRGRPDRIVVGEIRSGNAALETLKAWNTGHPGGITTIHADSADSAIPRLDILLQEAVAGSLSSLIYNSVDLIVGLAKTKNKAGRAVEDILHLDPIKTPKEVPYDKQENFLSASNGGGPVS